MWYKKNEVDEWFGHELSIDDSFGVELFKGRPNLRLSSSWLKAVPPQPIEEGYLQSIPKMLNWMEQPHREWWRFFLVNQVFQHVFHFERLLLFRPLS
jgi:hypothetical protein